MDELDVTRLGGVYIITTTSTSPAYRLSVQADGTNRVRVSGGGRQLNAEPMLLWGDRVRLRQAMTFSYMDDGRSPLVTSEVTSIRMIA